MKELDEIRARLEKATPGPWYMEKMREHSEDVLAYAEDGAIVICEHAGSDAEFIAAAPTDLARLLAAVEAVEAALVKHGNPEPAIPEFGEFDTGYRAGRRALRSILEAALTAALTPTPAVPGGAGESRGAVVAVEGAGVELGPEIDAWQFRGGDLVEWYGEGGIWKVIPSNIYDDKYASIQRERGNRVIMSVPCEELRHVGRKP